MLRTWSSQSWEYRSVRWRSSPAPALSRRASRPGLSGVLLHLHREFLEPVQELRTLERPLPPVVVEHPIGDREAQGVGLVEYAVGRSLPEPFQRVPQEGERIVDHL